jgi:hypothetical protein
MPFNSEDCRRTEFGCQPEHRPACGFHHVQTALAVDQYHGLETGIGRSRNVEDLLRLGQ